MKKIALKDFERQVDEIAMANSIKFYADNVHHAQKVVREEKKVLHSLIRQHQKLGVTKLSILSGYSRQGIYDILKRAVNNQSKNGKVTK